MFISIIDRRFLTKIYKFFFSHYLASPSLHRNLGNS
nr:MAG TPA: hypothetical protein [Caudoviricetes sp.]